uniref:Uncharacterized protein n=1 Tax=viral metagenome TaxID=1070528 RepID=A0A6M3LQU2_9ZZZZ
MNEEKTLLDDLKKLEETKRKKLLAKILNQIKEDAQEILHLKLSFDIYMEELGVDKKEAKSIIDWINSLVKVTDKDEKDLREEIRTELKEEKKKVDKKIEDSPYIYPYNTTLADCGSNATWIGGTTTLTSAGNTNTVCYSNSGEIGVQ